MPTILLSAPYMIPFLDRFRPALARYGLDLIVPEVRERLEENELMKYAGQFDGAICGDDRYTARVLEACAPRLKVVSKWGTGIDSIDAAACARLGIKLCRTVDAFTQPVSDSVMGYILAFARRQPWMDREMKLGKWEKLLGRALRECTLGIIGVGHVGKTLTRRARAFGMNVLGNDVIEIDPAFIAETGIRMTGLDSLLAEADFVSVNCDLNPTSRHLINARTLSRMRPTAVLINTARGPIVDEAALVAALQAGTIAGAALDTFATEPLPADHPFWEMKNVIVTPHISGMGDSAYERGMRIFEENLKRFLKGERRNLINYVQRNPKESNK